MGKKSELKKNNKIPDKNYFGYVYNLRLLKKELFDVKNIEDIEIIFPKIMSYIYANDTLLELLKEQIDIYLNLSEDHEKFYINDYIEIQNITRKIIQKQGKKIEFGENGRFKYYITKKNKIQSADIPILCWFTSVEMIYYNNESKIKTFEVSNSLKDMYSKFNLHYCRINILKNVECFVAWAFSHRAVNKQYSHTFLKENRFAYLITCMNYTLNIIISACTNKIQEEYCDESLTLFKNLKDEESEQNDNIKDYVLTYNKNKFRINNKILDISDTLAETLEKILDLNNGKMFVYKQLSVTEQNRIKSHKLRINKAAMDIIGQELLEYSRKEKAYKLSKNIHIKTYNTD